MFPVPLPALFMYEAPPRPKAPPPAGVEVKIQARAILLPHLPANVAQAGAEYRQILPLLTGGLQDLELDLAQLYAQAPAMEAPAGPLRVKAFEAEEARFFAGILNDREYVALQKPMIKAWNEWQGSLVEAGLAEGRKPEAAAARAPAPVDKDLKARLARQDVIGRLVEENLRRDSRAVATADGVLDRAYYGQVLGDARKTSDGITTVVKKALVTDRRIPELVEAWTPFVAHLNACAEHMATLDTGGPGEPGDAMGLLKLKAKIAFLERCRSALWFSRLVWARMSTHPDPAPLKNLRPPPR